MPFGRRIHYYPKCNSTHIDSLHELLPQHYEKYPPIPGKFVVRGENRINPQDIKCSTLDQQ
jgi:hypothetical protein